MSSIDESLSDRNILKLHMPLRGVALAAANGSLKDLARVRTVLEDIPKDQAVLLLPVFYGHLSPSLIPTTDALEAMIESGITTPAIECADKALTALSKMVQKNLIPPDASPDLWPRVWPWMEFLHVYWDYLGSFTARGKIHSFLIYTSILLFLQDHPESTAIVCATSGVRVLIAQAWKGLLHSNLITNAAAPKELIRLVIPLTTDIGNPANFDEILDGVGGTNSDLVDVIITHISLALSFPTADTVASSLTLAINFTEATNDLYPEFQAALLSGGIITSLISAFNTVTGHPLVLHTSSYLQDWPTRWMVEALQAGLLPCIISHALNNVGIPKDAVGDVTEHLDQLVLEILPRALISYPVITQMHVSLADVEEMASTADFRVLPLFRSWTKLVALAEERIQVVNEWEDRGMPLLLQCDSMLCENVKRKQKFGCCSDCRIAVYCSRECQQHDWLNGHREMCQALYLSRQHNLSAGLAPRERAFMRALLLDAEYERARVRIALETIAFMHQHPDEPDAFCVEFDYTRAGGVKVGVFLLSTMFSDLVVPMQSAVTRSGGRVQIHAMRVVEGGQHQHRVFPLRAASPSFFNGLKRIAREIPADVDVDGYFVHIQEHFFALVESMDDDVFELH
ncbi:hypothetical protein DFH06DRAFT_1486488 [Mycena polygramma]|nr:hypothetical protein DFH06DRAFT_1486488 [Mycena polygramma]